MQIHLNLLYVAFPNAHLTDSDLIQIFKWSYRWRKAIDVPSGRRHVRDRSLKDVSLLSQASLSAQIPLWYWRHHVTGLSQRQQLPQVLRFADDGMGLIRQRARQDRLHTVAERISGRIYEGPSHRRHVMLGTTHCILGLGCVSAAVIFELFLLTAAVHQHCGVGQGFFVAVDDILLDDCILGLRNLRDDVNVWAGCCRLHRLGNRGWGLSRRCGYLGRWCKNVNKLKK